MSTGQDKTVTVKFAVDQSSAQQAARLFRDLTSEVQKFVAATRQADQAFGGGGGGLFGAKGSNIGAAPGTSAQTQMRHQVVGAGSGLAKTLAGAVQNSATLFKGAADGSKSSFKIMSDALKRHVTDSDRDIQRLVGSLQKLEKQYDRLKVRQASGMGGRLTGSAMSQLQGEYYEAAGSLASARKNRMGFEKAAGALDTEADVAGANGPMGRVRGFFASKSDSIQRGVESVAGKLGIPTAALGGIGVGAAIAAGVQAGLKVAGAGRSTEMANLGYQIDQPMFRLNAQAGAGNIFGGNALALHHGDVARAHAMRILAGDTDYKNINGADMATKLRTRRNLENPDTFIGKMAAGMGGGVGGTISGGMGYLSGKVGAVAADFITGDKNMDVNTLARMRAKQEQQMQQAEMAQRALEAKIAADPGYNDRWNSLYSGALGGLGMARGAGISGGLVRIGKTDKFMDQLSQFEGMANDQGYTGAERVGARQRMAGTVGRNFMGRGDFSLLNLEAGGLGNAAQIRSAGAQFNRGNFGAFEKSLVGRGSMTGRGGVDTTAANQVLGAGAGAMMAGNFNSGGAGFMQSMLEATYTGDGTDMRQARATVGGLGAMGNMMSGGIDPLQQALNASAAMKAAPNAPWSAKDALMKMSPATMLEFMKTKRVPADMAAMGVSREMMEKFVAAQNSTAFARVNDKMLAGTDAGSEVQKYKAAGGMGYLRGKKPSEIAAAIKRLAPALRFAGGAGDLESAEGRLRLQASAEGVRLGGKGRGAAFNVDMKSARGVAAQQQGLEQGITGVKLGEEDKVGKGDIQSMSELGVSQDVARKDAQRAMATGDPALAIRGVSEALTSFVHVLEGLTEKAGMSTGRAKGAPSSGHR